MRECQFKDGIAWSRMEIQDLAIRAPLAELIATAAQKQKHLAKADMSATRKSMKCARKVAKRAGKRAQAAQKARR
jgi:hypothetical protein